jgi:hypothetical protein
MKKRDVATLRRMIDEYGIDEVAQQIGVHFDVYALARRDAGDIVGQRWNERVAKAVPYFMRLAVGQVDGRLESQPEIDNIIGIG